VVKSSSALLAPLFLRLGWWRALLAGLALAALNAPYFLWRPDDFTFFRQRNAGFLTEAKVELAHQWANDHGALALVREAARIVEFDGPEQRAAYTIALAAVVGPALFVTFFSRAADPLALFAIWVSAFFLFYRPVWEFHYVMLLPALALLVALRPRVRPWALATFALLAIPTPYWLLNHVLNTGPVPEGGFDLLGVQRAWPSWGVLLYHAVKPVPVAALWIYLVASSVRQGVTVPWLARLPWPDGPVR
jgi:hypothetical protein